MLQFTIDPRNGTDTSSSCDTCCCDPASGKPGETNPWMLNYAQWTVPQGRMNLTQSTEFFVEPVSEKAAPTMVNTNYGFGTVTGVTLADTVATNASPAAAYTYALVPFGGPDNGNITFNADGSFSYVPTVNWMGYDYFWYEMTDPTGIKIRRQVSIHVAAVPVPIVPEPDVLLINHAMVTVNKNIHQITFPVGVSLGAVEGNIYRLSVKQGAIDCEGNPYTHVSCYDVLIGKCL